MKHLALPLAALWILSAASAAYAEDRFEDNWQSDWRARHENPATPNTPSDETSDQHTHRDHDDRSDPNYHGEHDEYDQYNTNRFYDRFDDRFSNRYHDRVDHKQNNQTNQGTYTDEYGAIHYHGSKDKNN